MLQISGKITISEYAPNGDRLWLEINGGQISVRRGWSPSPHNPLQELGALPDTARLEVIKHLEAIGKIVSDAFTNWQI